MSTPSKKHESTSAFVKFLDSLERHGLRVTFGKSIQAILLSCSNLLDRTLYVWLDHKRDRWLLRQFQEVLGDTKITLLDVGAAGDIQPRWKKIAPRLDYIGIEPDDRSRVELLGRQTACASYQILPQAIWDKEGRIDIHLCSKPRNSSHYRPRSAFLNLFPNAQRYDVVSVTSLETTLLDKLAIPRADFLKLDIQGGELAALRGGKNLLGNCLGLEVEVEFLRLYEGVPLYGEISDFLTAQGFEFVDFADLCRWERHAHSWYGQCVFGDAVFLRPPEALLDLQKYDVDAVMRYVSICALYNKFDLVERAQLLFADDPSRSLRLRNAEVAIDKLRRRDMRARRISATAAKLVRLYGREYRTHLFG